MQKTFQLIFIFILGSFSYTKAQNTDFDYNKITKISDSIKVQNITIHNLFKSQIIAHKNKKFDSAIIVKNVYLPHKKLWDSCYAQIFGDENASRFNTKEGMIKWNKTLFDKNKNENIDRTNTITKININKLFKKNLKKFNRLVPYQPNAKISILFTPITGIGFGGCDAQQFALELNNKSIDIVYTLEKGLPHELNHLVYEKFRNNDIDRNSALSQTIDEGFACYFTYIFFDKKIPEYEAVENMTKENWDWYVKNEKAIFLKTKSYFQDTSGNNPLLRNDKHKIFPDAPKSLNYWLGYRIISEYVKKHGPDSWKDIYKLTAKEVLEKSGYEEYLEKL
ncbi:DUF2268 domain-containing putative Zn-dependent protease [Empedobacter sedimenti]|uniref:DUF2268 domain-containing putative Zn-dependent protease n=1 Tax=Empedobacter sedimenti TaxID=3042610 RepID=UPI0024A79ACC|nr:DUF2268 domain-containing putative Zn-dependent protease [Empedobacter sedimenti]